MARIRPVSRVKFFVGILTSIPEIVPVAEARLSSEFGPIDLRSSPMPFAVTHYYDATMGSPIQRYFVSFSNLISPGALAEIKVKTNSFEEAFAKENRSVERPVNLDPGYLEQSKVILASTKNFYHRIFLSSGIYAEVTLHFESGQWHAFPWTFPDFRSGRYSDFFTSLRNSYRSQLRTYCEGRGDSHAGPAHINEQLDM